MGLGVPAGAMTAYQEDIEITDAGFCHGRQAGAPAKAFRRGDDDGLQLARFNKGPAVASAVTSSGIWPPTTSLTACPPPR